MPRISEEERMSQITRAAIGGPQLAAVEETPEPTTKPTIEPTPRPETKPTREPVKPTRKPTRGSAKKPAATTAPAKPRVNPAQMALLAKEQQRIREFEQQESRRATRIMVDTTPSLIFALILAGTGLLTAFIVSYSTLVAVAGWMQLEQAWLAYIVPAFIEAMIVFSTIDYIIARSRGASTSAPFAAIAGFSAVAVIGNLAHSLNGWMEQGEIPWYGYVGILISALVPLVVVYLSKRLASLVFSEPIQLEDES